ncbi:hypothetical protein [Haloarcula sp. K1]|uniref:hypothetical protein n=1 Tax=Haloarcula sp. K1 TaxID=1622207 RepID=UPI0007BB4EB5|nr:hypothetical protein [Haloarcula sp. K1]KZX46325.1 hypothetical protein AV929_16270 [Haloarcula sp. K1]
MMSASIPLFLGGLLSPLQIFLMVLFLFSSGMIFTVVRKELSTTGAIGIAGGLWFVSFTMTFLML